MKTQSNARQNERKSRIVSARISAESYDVVEAIAEAGGVTPSRAIEMLIRRHHDLDVNEIRAAATANETRKELNEVRDAFNDAHVQLQRIGNNVNQATMKAHQGNNDSLVYQLDDFTSAINYLRMDMNSLIQAIQARSEGD